MAPFSWVLLLFICWPLFVNGTTRDGHESTSHQNHQHRGSSHHHRNNAGVVSWPARHNSHTAQYPHNRHNHESFLRRESRLLGYRSLGTSSRSYLTSTSSSSTTTARTTTLTTTTTSRSNARSYARPREAERQNAALSSSVLEPSASRSVIFDTVVHRDAHRDNYNFGTTPATTYSKFQPGRRVCSSGSDTTSTLHHLKHRQPRLAYTDPQPSGFLCCPGWTQVTQLSFGCNKPVCLPACQNGGVCSSPGRCTCPKGYAGNYCQIGSTVYEEIYGELNIFWPKSGNMT